MAEIMMPVRVLDGRYCKTCPNLDIHVDNLSRLYSGDELVQQKIKLTCGNIRLCAKLADDITNEVLKRQTEILEDDGK